MVPDPYWRQHRLNIGSPPDNSFDQITPKNLSKRENIGE